MSYMHNIY